METKIEEIWKEVPGYEGLYDVSNLGRVRAVRKNIILKLHRNKRNYLRIKLRKSGIKTKQWQVHRLVMFVFIGESELQVDHINNIKDDNRLSNLRYCTPRENIAFYHQKTLKTSKYTGVYFKNEKWKAQIWVLGKSKHLGYFENEYDAHLAYQEERRCMKLCNLV